MSLPLNFKSLLNLYNIDIDDTFKFSYTLEENVSIFTSFVDRNGNGEVDIDEYQDFLKAVWIPPEHVNNIFNNYDSNNNNSLSNAEFLNALSSFDANGNNKLDFDEALNFFNHSSDWNIDPNTSFGQYSRIYSAGESFIKSLDKNSDNAVSTNEYRDALIESGMDSDVADDLIAVWDKNNDSKVDLGEYLEKGYQWDVNKDGIVTWEEMVDLHPFSPENIAQESSQIELMANGIIVANDADQDGELSLEEYENYLGRAVSLPTAMAEEAMAMHGGGDGKLSFDELVSAYKSYDSNNDDGLDYEEMIRFQNDLTVIDIDTSDIDVQQYMGLFGTAQSMIKMLDGDFDGEITVKDYRAAIKAQEKMMKQYYPDMVEDSMVHMAENFVRFFDMDKSGSVNIIELINTYALDDTNDDGILSGGEFSDTNDRLEDSTLWDQVTTEIIEIADKDSNADLSEDEFNDYLAAQGMPGYATSNAFTMFDLNQDNELSRLELMEMYSRYDGSALNTEYIEAQTGNAYKLYEGNADNYLDSDERLQMFTDLSGKDFGANADDKKQYNVIIPSLQEFVKEKDQNSDGFLSPEEYKVYLKEQGLPDYIADNALNMFDTTGDNALDLFEWIDAHINFDENKTGELEINEALKLYGVLSNVPITPDDTNTIQYAELYSDSQSMIQQFDLDENRILDAAELNDRISLDYMPEYVAQEAVKAFDLNGDNGVDALEWLKASVDVDTNSNGIMEFNEKIALYDQLNGTGLNPDETNIEQYSIIYDAAEELMKSLDVDENRTLNADELRDHLKEKGLPDYVVNGAINLYDINNDGGVDILEYMRATADFDADLDGKLSFHEELKQLDAFSGIGMGINESNSDQYASFYNQIGSVIQSLDFDNDEKLSNEEFREKMKQEGLPDYLADNAVSAYDINGDGAVDALEWTQARVNYDKDQDGQLDFNEELLMNSSLSGVTIDADADQIAQYQALYNYVDYFMKLRDDYEDKILTSEELADYFEELDLPAINADAAISLYDVNGDGGLDIYEWMKPHIDYDVNQNGKLDFNEQMSMNGEISGVEISVDDTNAKQIYNIHNYAKKMMALLDQNSDKTFDANEYKVHFQNLGLPDYLADKAIAEFDVDGDNALNIMEFMKANLNVDTNANGVIEFDETMNYYADITSIPFSVDESNLKQYSYQYKNAIGTVGAADLNGDKKLNLDEYTQYLEKLGLSDQIAIGSMASFDRNSDGSIDALEYMDMTLKYDANESGAFDMEEKLRYYSDMQNLDIDTDSTNYSEHYGLYASGVKMVGAIDVDSDNKISSSEYKTYLKQLGLPEYMADNAIGIYDANNDGGIDSMEYMKMSVDFDSNHSGVMEFNEVLNYYSQISGINLGSTDENLKQHSYLYKTAVKTVAAVDKNKNNQMDAVEYGEYLKAIGLSSDLASKAIAKYDLNGDNEFDAMEYLKMSIDLDSNNSGILEFNELMDYYGSISGINFGTTVASMNQHSYLYKYGVGMVKGIDKDLDNKFDEDEYKTYLKAVGLPEHLAGNAIAKYDLDGDGNIDGLEYTKMSIDFDSNSSGKIEFNELMDYYSSISGISLGTTQENTAQHAVHYKTGVGMVKSLDVNADKKFDSSEYKIYLQKLGLPDYLADEAISRYDVNNDGGLDALEWMNVNVDFDANNNGKMDFDELIEYYDSLSGLGFKVTPDNLIQNTNAYKSGIGFIKSLDTNFNKSLSADELSTYLYKLGSSQALLDAKAIYNDTYTAAITAGTDAVTAKEQALDAYNASMADFEASVNVKAARAVSMINKNSDGEIDGLEWMQHVLHYDTNKNGLLDVDEIMAFYDSL